MTDVDKEKVKNALDNFENGEYLDSEEELKNQIRTKVKSHVKDKLGLDHNLDSTDQDSENSNDSEEFESDEDSEEISNEDPEDNEE
mgnify:CR=1 FL=1